MNIEQVERYSPADWFYDVRHQLQRHVYDRSLRAFAEGDAARDALTTPEAVRERQRGARETLIAGLGGLPSMDTPLEAQTVGTVERERLRIERVIFQSRPGHHVTANLYLPDAITTPTAAVLFLCGHHMCAKHEPEYQEVCQHLALAGLVVLAQDPIGQGERLAYWEPALNDSTISWGTTEHDHAGAQCLPLGDTLGRYFVHDAMRGIDYLASRPEVDASRIGVTGNSGGGTQTSLLLLCDPRIAAAAPATFIMNRETYLLAGGAQDAEQIWPGFSAGGYDHEDILIAVAPKPMRVLAVTGDFFPIEGTRRTVARCKRLWGLFGREEAIDLVEDQAEHWYTPKLARAAAAFFSKHLLGREVEVDSAQAVAFPPESLWCTRSGQVRGEIAGAAFVHEENVARLLELEKARAAVAARERSARAAEWLRGRVMKDREPCDLNPRYLIDGHVENLRVKSAVWWAQEGLFGYGCLFRDFHRDGERLPVTLAIWDDGTSALRRHIDWIRQTCEGGRAVCVLDVSGSGNLLPAAINGRGLHDFYGTLHKFATDLLFLADDLAALRTWDVLRALEMLALWPDVDAADLRLYAHGRYGLYGQLAAALDGRIGATEVVGGIGSYAQWVRSRHYDPRDIYAIILRDALRYFDLQEMNTPPG